MLVVLIWNLLLLLSLQVANLVCSMSNNEDGVKMVRHAADHIEALCPQVGTAGDVRGTSRKLKPNYYPQKLTC